MPFEMDPEQRVEWLAQLKFEALSRRPELLAWIGPEGRTPLDSVSVITGGGGPRRLVSDEGVTSWDEPDRLYLARFIGSDGESGMEVQVEEDDALRWAFALGWGEPD